MAKSHIRDLVRILARKYEEANSKLEEVALILSDTMLSPEEQERFAKVKARVDNSLSTLSVSLSAAAQGKLVEVYSQLEAERLSYVEPLQQAIDNLSEDLPKDIRQQTLAMVSAYNANIQLVQETLSIVRTIDFWKNFVSNRRKQRKYFRTMFCKDCAKGLAVCSELDDYCSLEERKQAAYSCYSIFKQVDAAMLELGGYLTSIQDTESTEIVDDMSE